MKKTQLAAIILAAGKGTRMKSKTSKVMHKIANEPLLGHVVNTTSKLQAEKVVTVISTDMQDTEDYLKNKTDIAYQQQQLGTADAVKSALPKLQNFNGNVVILYGDTPLVTQNTIEELLQTLEQGYSIGLLAFEPDDPAEYGRVIAKRDKEVEKIVEFKDASVEEKQVGLCNSGVLAIKSDALYDLIPKISNDNAKQEYYLTDILELAKQNNLKCSYNLASEKEVLGVNNRYQLSVAEEVLQERLRLQLMSDGVTLIDPKAVYLSSDVKIANDVIIYPNVYIGKNVEIGEDTIIHSFSHIEDAKIAKGCNIGPYARIRPGTDIGDAARIGNFVEVKKSKIDKGAKINHLSYIGDAKVGSDTNIGAGTITCNYDGKNKHQTVIGKEAFIGSDSILVAPVNIGDNSLIAAGSTISGDVPAKSLAIARSRQTVKENWRDKDDK